MNPTLPSHLGMQELFQDWGCTPNQAALFSAIPEALVKGPIEALKNLQQTQLKPTKYWVNIGKGTLGMLLREMPLNVCYFWLYRNLTGESSAQQLAAGATTGAITGALFYPIEALRSQWTTDRPLHITYKGSGAYLVRVTFLTAFLFTSYEAIITYFAKPTYQRGR